MENENPKDEQDVKLQELLNKIAETLYAELGKDIKIVLLIERLDNNKLTSFWNCHHFDAARLTAELTRQLKSTIMHELDVDRTPTE